MRIDPDVFPIARAVAQAVCGLDRRSFLFCLPDFEGGAGGSLEPPWQLGEWVLSVGLSETWVSRPKRVYLWPREYFWTKFMGTKQASHVPFATLCIDGNLQPVGDTQATLIKKHAFFERTQPMAERNWAYVGVSKHKIDSEDGLIYRLIG